MGEPGCRELVPGDMNAVREDYEKALAARQAIEDRILEGKTLNGLGSVHWRLGEYEKAMAYYDRGRDVPAGNGDMGGVGISLTYKGTVTTRPAASSTPKDAMKKRTRYSKSTGVRNK